ncbi:bifunctional tetrahydrofolate synthase/dihydrofolate synthase [Acidovorax lacteus]|uniref:Dihydrofolate synthase/folylpolyglutamate synthase n=2 Tax=Acidovorax lacteus TaxID=1924988 RepID=A0ABP8L5M0_9BURK
MHLHSISVTSAKGFAGSATIRDEMHSKPVIHTLEGWLRYCEQLHPAGIAMGLDRVGRVARRLGLQFACPVITVAGTNGKGSTCAMLEAICLQAGYRTAVYASPHLVRFEERCRLHGEVVSSDDLLTHFDAVEHARTRNGDEVALTYFEFTTLAIMRLMAHSLPDVVILEVGLGGRLDATNIIDADCSVITSIDIDHAEFLGPDRESIGREKAGIMRTGRPVIVSDPVAPNSVVDHAREVGADLWLMGRDFNYSGDKQQWSWAGRGRRYAGLGYPGLRGANQLLNASGAIAALMALRQQLPVTAQAIRSGLAMVELPGRFQIVPGQPTLVLDVAHNPHSVAALMANLDAMGFYPATHAVFGAMADKDLGPMLTKMAPLVDHWYFTDLPTSRAESAQNLLHKWHAIEVVTGRRKGGTAAAYGSPTEALAAAVGAADTADRIAVFGSFYTVGGVLQEGVPRLQAKHLQA